MRLIQDVQFALRVMLKRPASSLLAVAILALGVGANIAVFSVVDAAFLRPLPISEPERVVTLYQGAEGEADPYGNHSYPDFIDLRTQCADVIDLCAKDEHVALHVGSEGGAVRVNGALVSGNYFTMLGVNAARGRLLTPNDDITPGGSPVVVVSHRFWRTQLGGAEDVVGRELRLNGRTFEIIGVAAEGFDGTERSGVVAAWAPITMFNELQPGYQSWGDFLTMRSVSWMDMIGRMRDGVTIPQVEQAINAGYQVIADTDPMRADFRCRAMPIDEATINPDSRQAVTGWLSLIMVAVGLVMLIACSNVATLQLSRLHGRRREIAVRLALGASRWRLSRQLLTESLLLALVGGAAGLVLAQWFGGAALGLLSREGSFSAEALRLDPDVRIVVFTLGLTIGTGVLFGLAPSLLAARRDPLPALKSDRSGTGQSQGRLSIQNMLVSGQVGLSFVLVIGASLLLVSLQRLQGVRLGFDPEHVLVASLDLARQGMDETRGRQAWGQILEDIRNAPGVESAAIANLVPVTASSWNSNISVPGYEPGEAEEPRTHTNYVSPEYFATMRIPLLRGRSFTAADDADAPKVAIINQTMAERYWPHSDAVGKSFSLGATFDDPIEVVGVVADSKYNTFRDESLAFSYYPFAQQYQAAASLVVRCAGEPFTALPVVREAARRVDPGLPVFDVRSLEQQLSGVLARDRLTATLFGAFGAAALVLVMAGLYGVLSNMVNQRVREIGIRMAVGAERRQVLRHFLLRGVRITGAGLLVGVPASLLLTRGLRDQLYAVHPADPLVMSVVAGVIVIVGLLACWAPARRATRIDPMVALRSE